MGTLTLKGKKTDESLVFLNRFVELYEDVLCHEGYADLHIEIRNKNSCEKEVLLKCGKQYRYSVAILSPGKIHKGHKTNFKVVRSNAENLRVPQNRRHNERRKHDRRKAKGPWNFRLERRVAADRRKYRERRD